MDVEVTLHYELYIDDNESFFIEHENDSDGSKVTEVKDSVYSSFFISLLQFIYISLKVSVLCGILFGFFTTLLWWIELNVRSYWNEHCKSIPTDIRHLRLLVDSFEIIARMYWPLLTIAPVCSWSMIKESNVLFWCTITGLVNVLGHWCCHIFGNCEMKWQLYAGHVIFVVISFIVFYKFAWYRQRQSCDNKNTVIITFKILVQIIVGFMLSLPYNFVFLVAYVNSRPLVRTIMSCSLIAVLFVLKLIVCKVVADIRGIFYASERILFVSAFLIITTMVARLTQTAVAIENLAYFVIISLVHGITNVIDKGAIPLRRKIINSICRRNSDIADEAWIYTQQDIAHQSLISIITETSSVVMTNAAAYLMIYYYKMEEITGKRYDGWYLFKKLLIRWGIAVFIEWFFNIIALKLQYHQKFPVIAVWKKKWKLILAIHLIQVVYVVVYYGKHVDAMLLDDLLHNSTSCWVGQFRRL